jgi:hypothetical protein
VYGLARYLPAILGGAGFSQRVEQAHNQVDATEEGTAEVDVQCASA